MQLPDNYVPKEYHTQKDEGLEDLEREGAEKEFGKITAWFTEKKALASCEILFLQQSQPAITLPTTQNII